ncbi:hypothetical protein E2562_019660 [Oryza meyeriana var. granulata]|uniref:Uncharacterized protein n=1 Tax=Oryza meyeriana var. granulata TaxID=110450 RepID=A0A6G1C848_9ORYZ|nr:hypothetical protein E2562_019660 [Oryza meyeriana var. granulata]
MDAQGALDSLLGRLTAVLVSEAKLLGGVRGDVEFIKDEMESMDSLVAHIMEAQHRDRQVRTWMRHVAGLSRDCEACVMLYLQYVTPGPAGHRRGGKCCGLLAYLRRIPRLVRTIPARHRVATRIRELKVRALDVGERRLKYGITVPPAAVVTDDDMPPPARPPGWPEADYDEEDLKRRELLYGEPPVQWSDTVDRSWAEMNHLYLSLRQYRKNTSRIMLMFCYNELPVRYKTCLQYMSIFPQGHIFRRTRLIRRWLTEGLVIDRRISGNNLGSVRSGDHHNSSSSRPLVQLEEQAEHVFGALVARGFLHPEITSAAGKIKTCTMHHIVHDFIATEASFMDTCIPPDVAHRLSINSGIALEEAAPPESNSPFHRILSLLGSIPGSDQWQLLKVLDLEDCKGLKKKHLKNICKIVLLKYLSLRNTDVTQLPKQIKELQCLETFDIRQTEIRAFSTKSVFFPMLKHLLAGSKGSPSRSSNNSHRFEESLPTVQLPSGTQRMKRLQILSHVDASNNVDDLISIGQLLQLRKLGVVLDGKKAGGMALLFEQIEKLHGCLCSLSIWINHLATSEGTVPETEKIANLASPPKLLQSLNISGITSGLPNWITKLERLTEITLRETYLAEDAIQVLGKLRILRCLRLRCKSYTGTNLTFSAEEFKHLKSLIVEGCDITTISFTNIGAAPKLEMIIWSFASVETLSLSGIDYLPKLKKLELNGDKTWLH